jgi:hypothetical protein
MTRCTLLVDKVAMASCATNQLAALPLPAVRTTNGLSAKSRRDAACSTEGIRLAVLVDRAAEVACGRHADQAAQAEAG